MRTFSLLLLGVVLTWMLLARHDASLSATSTTQEILRVPQDYPTIQAAIDAAPEGATIQIAPGLYVNNLKITKSLTLEGSGIEATILEPALGFRDRDNHNPIITVEDPQEKKIRLHLTKLTLRQPTQPSEILLRYGSFDEAIGLKVGRNIEDKVYLSVENTKWLRFDDCISTMSRLHRLELRKSRFERNTNFKIIAAEVEIVENVFLEGSVGPWIQGAKHLRVQDNKIIGSSVSQTETRLILDEGGRGEVIGNTIASVGTGLIIDQVGEEAHWILRSNWFVGNIRNIQIGSPSPKSVLPRFDILVEENTIVDGNLGIEIFIAPHGGDRCPYLCGGWGEIRLHRNHILKQRAVRHPEDPSLKEDLFSSHGVTIESPNRDWPRGQVKIEFIDNQIEFNEGWGLAINYGAGQEIGKLPYRCVISGMEYQGKEIVPPLIVGSNNIFRNNTKGDLCPADYPWPPGFRK